MRLKLFILIFSFANLLITPTIMLIQPGADSDVSFFINLNEEENSEKSSISFGEIIADESSHVVFSQDFYFLDSFAQFISHYKSVYQKIVSPPPDFKLNYFS